MSETEKLVFRVHIEGTIEDVWREITKTDEAQQCMFNAWLHTDGLEPGGKVRMRTASGKYTSVVGEILEFDPPHRYAHTFRFTNYDDPPCTMTYELKQVEGGVEFTLTADGVPVGTKTGKQVKQGGKMIVDTLKAVVETGRPPLFTRMLYRVFAVLEPLSPARCKTEHWP